MQGALLRIRRGFCQSALTAGKRLALAGLLALPAATSFAQSAIEMDAASANAGTQTTGVHVTTLPVTLRNNSDNPGGTTFGAVSPGPAPVATFTLSNQAYTAPTVPATVSSTRTGVFMGMPGNTAPNAYFAPMSSIGSPANAHFTSLPYPAINPAGQGINTATNHGVRITASASALQLAGAPVGTRVSMADLDISFNVPVTDPVLHLSGLGGTYGSLGFSAEFNLLPAGSPNVTGLALLSGNGALSVVGNSIINSSANPAASCSVGAASRGACGSVRVTGDGITNIKLRVFLRGGAASAWSDSRTTTGDAFHISVSTETADMTPAFSGLPAQIVPGTSYPATLTCTNAGPNMARDATCVPTASIGTISVPSCTPVVPGDIGPTAPNNKTVCTFDYTLPVGGNETSVVFTGQTGASNDRNGGAVGTAGNNQVQSTVPVRAPRLQLVKVLNGTPGRDVPTDQFTLTISGTSGTVAATTGGSGTTITGGSPVLATATAGQTYTLTESFAGTSTAGKYTTSYSCANALSGGTTVASGSGTSVTTPALMSGDDLTCTFTNTYTNSADLVTVKTLGAGGTSPVNTGDTVTFLITLTNQGPGTARNVNLTDLLPAGLTATAGNGAVSSGTYDAGTGLWTIPAIAPGVSRTLTLVGTVNADQGGATITNTIPAAPTADTTDPTTAGDDLTESVTVTAAPAIAVVKTSAYSDFNGNGVQDAGDRITYSYVVSNRGNTVLEDVGVTEQAGGFTGAGTLPTPVLASGGADLDGDADAPDLAFGASATFTATYTLMQADIDAGEVSNQAQTSASDPAGTPVSDLSHPAASTPGSDAPTVTTLNPVSRLGAVKSSAVDPGADGLLNAGDTISYTYDVTNTGATTVFHVGVTETGAAFTGTGTLPVPAYFTGGGDYDAGAGTATDLRPGEKVTFTATYILTQADLDAGSVTNQALAAGTDPQGGPVSDASDDDSTTAGEDDPTVTPLMPTPKIELSKSAQFVDVNGNGRADAGDRIDYAFTVENTGATTLTNISVSDTLPGISISGSIASLAPGATDSTSSTGSYTLTLADMNAGQVENQASVSGNPPSGPAVTDESDDPADPTDTLDTDGDPGDPTIQTLIPVNGLSIDKRLAAGSITSFDAVGDEIDYEFVVTNTGNVTLTGPFVVNDPLILSGTTCPAGALDPGQSLICTGTHVVTQANLDDGSFDNTATVFEDKPGSQVSESDPDTQSVPAVQTPELTMVKSTTEDDPLDFVQGNIIDYTYVVTNTGNVTITDPITVSDNRIASVSCPALPPGGLAPDGFITCTGGYEVTAEDLVATQVTNVASATDGTTTSNTDDFTIPQGATPGLSIEKSLVSVNGNTSATAFAAVGDELVYSYTVRNTGNAAYAADVLINDDKFAAPIVCFNSQGSTQSFPPYLSDPVNGEITCTTPVPYVVTQADVEADQITNTAYATSTYGTSTPVTSLPDSVTVPGTPDNSLGVVKTADPVSGAGVGDTITYTIAVTNTGNQTLTGVSVTDDKVASLTCDIDAPVTLAPNEVLTCEGPYVVTQADIDAELIENRADATGTPPQGQDPVTAFGEADHEPEDPDTVVSLLKSGVFNDANSNGRADAGETISYSFAVKNDGNQTLNDIQVTDPDLTPTLVGTIATLAPGAMQTLTATYPLTQADIDDGAGEVYNTATVTAEDPQNVSLTPVDDSATTVLPRTPAITLEKTGTLADTNGNGRDDAGDIITYAFTVTNTGNVTLTDVTLSDTSFPGLTLTGGPIDSLAPGAVDSTTFTASFTLTDAAMNGDYANPADPETVQNEATVTGTYQGPLGPLTVDGSDEVDVAITPEPGVTITKTADTSGLSTPPQEGEVITYSFSIENTGSVTLTDVTVTDTLAGLVLTGSPVTLEPGEVNTTAYSATYTLTFDDLDAGEVVNLASVSALPPNTLTPLVESDSATVDLPSDGRIEVVKSADTSGLVPPVEAGDLVSYEITVTNTGNKRLTDVVISDPLLGLTDVTVGTGTMLPGDVVILTAPTIPTYALTQADINRGYVDNQATADATQIVDGVAQPVSDASDDTANPTGEDDPTRVLLPADPAISLLKTGSFADTNGNNRADVGERVNYTFTVTNEGNVTLTNITLTDPLPGIVLAGGQIASLEPGETDSTTFRGHIVLTQAMITTGHVDNLATVSGDTPAGGTVDDDSHPTLDNADADTVVTLPQAPRLALIKTATFTDAGSGTTLYDGNGRADAGEIVTYNFRVTNTGNVPVTGITVTDTGIPGLVVTGGPVNLAPGASSAVGHFTASYPITQTDVNAGTVSNTAITSGTGPNSATVTDNSHPSSTAPGATAPTLVTLPRVPALTMDKTSPLGAPVFQEGEVVAYQFVVTNTGNTSIPGPITINDNMIGAINCGTFPGGGAPGAVLTCTANYTITENDDLFGSVFNNARATDGITQSPTSDELVPASATPALSIDKVLLSVNGNTGLTEFTTAGDVLRYRFTVTNTGGTSFPSNVYVTDDVISPGIGDILCWDFATQGSFTVGAVAVCEAEYEVTQPDLDRTSVTNEAFASGIYAPASPSPLTVQSPVDAVTVSSDIDPGISLVKSSDPAFGAGLGDTITYTLLVTNTGNQTLYGVTVTDTMLDDLSCSETAPVTLSPDAQMTCTGTHVVTQDDLDTETIPNRADVTSTSPQGAVISTFDTHDHTPEPQDPEISLEKTASAYNDANSNGQPDPGETITYTFVVRNSGNQTLNTISLSDPNLTPPTVATIATLAPGGSLTYNRVYPITQADLNATSGDKSNTATVTAKDPDGDDLTPVPDTATTPLPRDPELTLVKTGTFVEVVAPAGVQNIGDRIDYSITVRNTGNVTVTDIDVEDTLLGGLLTTIASLEPGQSQVINGSHVLTVTNVNAGQVLNTASASGTGSNGTALVPVLAEDDVTITLTRSPRITLVKAAAFDDVDGSNAASTGDTVTFTYTVSNMGNVTVYGVIPTETSAEFTGTGTLPVPAHVSGGANLAANAVDLDPGASAIWEAVYTLTADDIAAGGITNQAVATGDDPTGAPVTDASDESGTRLGDNDPTELTYNQAPVAEDDSSSDNAVGQPVTIDPLVANGGAADRDPDGTLVASSVRLLDGTTPVTSLVVDGQGTWTVDTTTGEITFTPLANFTSNPSPVDYIVADNDGAYSPPATVTIDYTAVPEAENDSSSDNAVGSTVSIDVTDNDTVDPNRGINLASVRIMDGTTPVTSLVVDGQGTWRVDTATGEISFEPQAGFTGDPTFISYVFADSQGNVSNPATVTIDYTDVPQADADESLLNAINATVDVDVLGNDDVDPDQTIDVTSVELSLTDAPAGSVLGAGGKTLTVPDEGIWTVNDDGTVSFDPEDGFTTNPTPVSYSFADNQGNRSDEATITITYTGAPVARDDSSSDNAVGSTVIIDVTADDEAFDGQTINLASVRIMDGTTPVTSLVVDGQGTWRVDTATGEISFEPEAGFTGDPGVISYVFADNQGNVSNPATVTIDYTDVPQAEADESLLNAINATVDVDVLGNDDVDLDQIIDVTSVELSLTDAPAGSFLGAGGKTLTVPDEGIWTVNDDGTVSFDPEDGFTTNPTPVSYSFADNQGNRSDEATITITYTGAPVATDDLSQDNPFGQPVRVTVFDNDTVEDNVDLDPASVRIMDGGTPVTSLEVDGEGTWTVDTDTGEIIFTPLAGFTGNPTPIDYRFADTQGNLSNLAEVTVIYTVPPVATDNASLLNPIGQPVTVQVFADDTASSGRTLVPTSLVLLDGTTPVTTLTVDNEGVWTVNTATGEITFTPDAGFEGPPTPVSYRVADDQGNLSNAATVTVTYTDRPVANDNALQDLPIGQPVTLDVLGNDSVADDREINPTTVRLMDGDTPVTSLTVPGEGVWTVDPESGAITFTPEDGFTTSPTPVRYRFADDQGNLSNTALVTLTYTGAPVATDNASNDNPIGQPVVLEVLADDSVADGREIDPTSVRLMDGDTPVTSLTVAGEGVWTVDPETGEITFTPEDGFADAPTPVRYRFADDQGNLSNLASLTITFTEPPVATDNNGEYIPGNPVTIAVMDDDSSPSGRPLDPASVQIVGTNAPGQPLVVRGEGTWSVDTTTGSIIFTPETGYTGDPTPIRYTVADDQGNRSNEATVTVVSAGIPEVELVIEVASTEDTNGDGLFGAGDTVFWSFTITNTGNVPLYSASIINPSLNMPGLSCSLPPEYAQPGHPGLLPGESVQLVCQRNGYRVTAEDVAAGEINLSATVVANDQVGQTASATSSAAALPMAPGGVTIDKTAALRNVRVGQLVPYTITVTNRSTTLPVTVNVTDTLPEGLIYRAGTGAVAGAAQEPVVTGSRLGFNGVAVPAGGAVQITLSAYVTQSARPGEMVNTAQAFSPLTGLPVSGKATASVMLGADPVFDCGTVIGRVFDDANQDGYMDGPVAYRDLTDDSYVADKFSVRPEPRKLKGGEPGIPGVRLVTVNGTIITTDEFGRFHVPCAELPSAIGQNFLLKLDERTLPTGYRMTTENPRVMRLTAGKMSEMNFGAAISKLVRIELSDAAFSDDGKGTTPRPELKAGLKQLLGQIAATPSSLRMTYNVGADGEAKAKARLRVVEAMIRDMWADTGRYKLNVEKELKR